MLAALLLCIGATGFAQSPASVSPDGRIDLLPGQLSKEYKFDIPKRPEGRILDLAHFLPEDVRKRLDEELQQESRTNGADVYVLVVPSLAKDTLAPFTKQVSDAWMKDLFGAVIVFDDATGVLSIEESEKLTKNFYEFELARLLHDSMAPSKRPRLSRAGLEHTIVAVKDAVRELKGRADKAEHNSRNTQLGLGIVALAALLIGAFAFLRRRSGNAGATSPTSTDEVSSP